MLKASSLKLPISGESKFRYFAAKSFTWNLRKITHASFRAIVAFEHVLILSHCSSHTLPHAMEQDFLNATF